MMPFPWRIGPARSNPSLRDFCEVSPRDDEVYDTFLSKDTARSWHISFLIQVAMTRSAEATQLYYGWGLGKPQLRQ